MTDESIIDSSAETVFECDVVDSDEVMLFVKKRMGQIIYVRILSGSLPSYLSNVLIHGRIGGWPHQSLVGRPAAGAFQPTPAELSVPGGRSYPVTVLASLPPLGKIRPYLRAALEPPSRLEPTAVPVAIEGFPYLYGFRTLAGRLRAVRTRGTGSNFDPQELWGQMRHLQTETTLRTNAIHRQVAQSDPDVAIDLLLEALSDEAEQVRRMAAHGLRPFASRLPLAPFFAAIEDRRVPNSAACLAAAYVFVAHADEVPIETLLDLYHNMSPGIGTYTVQEVLVAAMGHLGERVTDEVMGVLTDIVQGRNGVHGIKVRWQAALALERLGGRVPVDVLIAGMNYEFQPEVVAIIARALAQHPAQIPEETRERARLLSDVNVAKRIRYERLGVWPVSRPE